MRGLFWLGVGALLGVLGYRYYQQNGGRLPIVEQIMGGRTDELTAQASEAMRSAQHSTDLYELIIARHRQSSFAITSNRGVDEWLALFDDPLLGNSALDRLANAAHQIVMDGPSYRAKRAPKHREPEPTT